MGTSTYLGSSPSPLTVQTILFTHSESGNFWSVREKDARKSSSFYDDYGPSREGFKPNLVLSSIMGFYCV